jgi:hypothetical protein
MLRRRLMTLVLSVGLALSGLALAPTTSPVRAATSLTVCGTVTVLVKPSAILAGAVTIGAIPTVIVAGASVPAAVAVGANLCVRLELNLFGAATEIVVLGADVTTTVKICGTVTVDVAATSSASGTLKIAGRTFTTAVGSSLPAAVAVGADLCLTLNLNGLAQVKGGSATANVVTTLQICGTVTAHAAASLSSTGSLTIAGRSFALALGSSLPASVDVGANLCLSLGINVFGQVQNGTAMAHVTSTIEVCGTVAAFAAANSTSDGHLTIGSVSKSIAAGTGLSASVKAGAHLRLRLVIDAFGRIDDAVVLKVGVSLADACSTAAPTNSPSPTGSPSPSGSPSPTAAPTASPSPTPMSSPAPSATPSGEVDPSGDPGSSPEPTGGAGGIIDEHCGPGGPGGEVADLTGGVIPDTASLERAGSIAAAASVPFALLAGAMAFGYVLSGIRRRSTVVVAAADVDETPATTRETSE